MNDRNQVVSGEMPGIVDIVDEGESPVVDERLAVILKIAAADEALLSDEEAAIYHAYKRDSGIAEDADDHYANLAPFLEENELYRIADDVINWVRRDDESRVEWVKQEKEGMEYLGVAKLTTTPIVEGGSEVIHPLLAEACVQFWARAMDALWPSGAPVKSAVIGKTTDEKLEQAGRVEGFMNYLYTVQMEDAYKQTSKLLLRLPISGNLFTRPYYDHSLKRLERSVITPERFVVPYEADNLTTAQRYTEIVPMTQNTVRRMQSAGIFRDIQLQEPDERSGYGGADAKIEIEDTIKGAEGRDDVDDGYAPERHTVYYCTCELDLPGFEEDIALPYTVAVDRDSSKVLAIYRQWRKTDEHKQRLIEYTQHGFIPGLGFYDYGFFHLIGGLVKTATGATRALLDSALWENTQGGFKSEDLKVKGGTVKPKPNDWIDVKASAEEMKNGFILFPKTSPSQTLFNLLGFIVDSAQRFAGTTDAITGEGNANTPVGTTMARIEQGLKVYTGIQRGLHNSFGREYRRMFELCGLWLEDKYPYAVVGESSEVFKKDFDPEAVGVLPVSDPNFVSHTQRYFISQASIEIAEKSPELYDMREIHRRAQMTLRMDDLDSLMPPLEKLTQRMGPVEENAAVLQGMPMKVHPEQDDQAHLQVHMMFMQGLDNETIQSIGPQMQAHNREHMASMYLKQMQMQTGVQFQMPSMEAMLDDEWAEVPPEMENQIAMLAAQAAQAMAQPPQSDPEAEKAAGEEARKNQHAQTDIQRKDVVANADIQRKDAVAASDVQRKNAESVESQLLKRVEAFQTPPEME